ncbi:uncharacterized protein GGS22DRAFT_160641 [Annulohypoxylon maeteangense]|uniref:uncharacterized protein n=1 Tax=Annulohypoxylon maeteangense TaxID=1927788 RepID=UPI0020081A31|nr:uncharacterized protein GGS22DRAFT_160641 [Annulohypoxylon maeteangense]KAI0886355.1 hypothetical protein GGS22DRAFT_160641 [Annulohypoxylon maeteangense]
MNEGTYNNVIRSNSPFSPMTPSTANSYKANVNRTKTRKWVEAKVQNYDGDDWGNEYEEEYEDREPEPAPPTQPMSRIAALRQQAANAPQQRAFSQPTPTVDSTKPGPLEVRNASGPPALHIQTGVDPRSHLAGATLSAQSQARFPPRESSISQQETPGSRDIGASGSGTESGRPSVESGYGRTDANSPSVSAIRSSIEQRQRSSFESHNSSDNSRGLKQTLAPVEEQKNGPRALADETELGQSLGNQRHLSTSPKLPDLARMSGFGDDFFSSSGGSSPTGRPSLPPVSDNQRTSVAGAKPGPSSRPNNNQRDTTGLYEEKHAPSALEGRRLEPNPKIIMPPSDGDLEPKKEDPVGTFQQSAPSRPQLPGTWVSETVSAGSEHTTPAEKAEGPVSTSLGSIANPAVSPINSRHAEPADLEPTTAVKHLPSTQSDSEAAANNKTAQESGEDSFNRPTGKHDGAIASKVISSGPGFHPTHQFLPPLKTENPLAASNAAQKEKQDAPANEMAPRSSGQNDSPSRATFTPHSAATTGSAFAPTAPLNPRRSFAAPAEIITPAIQERKSTMSTVDTASPEKESDKLREEIFKSLSASPATTTPDASIIPGPGTGGYDPVPGALTRESTYLSGVYDEYLSLPEEKSLQETGQLLKQGPKAANETPSGPSIQRETSFPQIAPLSPRRSPVQEANRRPRRFSWENSADKSIQEPAKADSATQGENRPTLESELGAVSTPSALQVRPEGPSPVSHQVSQISSQSPGDLSSILPEPLSPISLPPEAITDTQASIPDISRLSFADEKEKVLIQESIHAPSVEHHPALSDPIELARTPSPTITSAPTAQSASNAKVMAFRDILNLVSIEQRIGKFEETQNQFYSMESGLSNWLSYMQSQPELGAGIVPLGGQPMAQGQTSPSGTQPPTQQPYYQQYLNASNPSAPPTQIGRMPSGSLQHKFTGQPMSSFGPSGKEVGAKSKELLQAAGAFGNKGVKSGMKLFNKGKNKLRGTGDKVFF